MHVCLVCSRIVPPAILDSDEEEDDDDVHLTLKELLAEFNDKVKAHMDEMKIRGIKNWYIPLRQYKTVLEM